MGFDHRVGHVWVLRRRSESLAVLRKRLQHGVGIVCENLVKNIGILRQSCKERKKNWEMFSRHGREKGNRQMSFFESSGRGPDANTNQSL
jgi:hypothetical protein